MSSSTSGHGTPTASPFKQPRAVWAVAFACVVSFMGIGLVDPILKTLAGQLHATASQVELLFTSYLVVTAVAMLGTGWVSSRIGAKRTLITGLTIIVIFSALAGLSDSIGGIVGFRAGWGLGNALFIATSLAVIVASATDPEAEFTIVASAVAMNSALPRPQPARKPTIPLIEPDSPASAENTTMIARPVISVFFAPIRLETQLVPSIATAVTTR